MLKAPVVNYALSLPPCHRVVSKPSPCPGGVSMSLRPVTRYIAITPSTLHACRLGSVMDAAAARSAAAKTRTLHAALLARAAAAGLEADRHQHAAVAAREAAQALYQESGRPVGEHGDDDGGGGEDDEGDVGDGSGFGAGSFLRRLPAGATSSARDALHSLVRLMGRAPRLPSASQQPSLPGGGSSDAAPQLGPEEEDGGNDEEVLLACTQAAILSSGRWEGVGGVPRHYTRLMHVCSSSSRIPSLFVRWPLWSYGF